MSKKTTIDAKWVVGGVTALLIGMWVVWGTAGQGVKIAEIYEEGSGETEYAQLSNWKFGTAYVKKGESAASKQWSYTQRYAEDNELVKVSVPKKKNFCMTYKLPNEKNYDQTKINGFRLKGTIKPTGVKIAADQPVAVVGKRTWITTFMDSRKKAIAHGEQGMDVVAPLAQKSGSTNSLVNDGSSGGGTSNVQSQSLVEVGPKDDIDYTKALKMAYVQLCLDQSSTENVDIELSQVEWLLDTRYLGPGEIVNYPTIVQ